MADALSKQGNEAAAAIGADSRGNAIYGFGGTTPVISADQLTPQPSINIPTSTGNINPADGLVSSVTASQGGLADYIKALTPAETPLDKTNQAILDRVAKLTADNTGRTQAKAQSLIDAGVPDLQRQIQELNNQVTIGTTEYNKFTQDYNQKIAESEIQPGVKRGVIDVQQGAQGRLFETKKASKAAEVAMIAAKAQAAAGNLNVALQIAQNAFEARYAPIEDELAILEAQRKAIEPSLTKQEKIQWEALGRQYQERKEKLAEEKASAKENVTLALSAGIQTKFVNKNGQWFDTNTGKPFATPEEFFNAAGVKSFEDAYKQGLVSDWTPSKAADFEFVQQARNKYVDAGILPTDSVETVKQKLLNSRIYRKETYIAPPSGGSTAGTLAGTSIIDPTTDAKVRQIIASRPGDKGWGDTYKAISQQLGSAVADKYNGVLDNVFRQGVSVDAAFNNMKLAETAVPEQYKGALSVILGSEKFTKEQKNSITQAISSGQNPLSVVKNQAKNIMAQPNATKLESYEVAKKQLEEIQSGLQQYYAAGGKTNVFKGNFEKTINKLGEVKDPNLVSLAVQIQGSLQQYRNAVSGTAYSVQEGADIASIFPGINKSEGLNDAIIKGRMKSFESSIDEQYRTVLGDSYDLIKGTSSVQSNSGLPQQMNLNGQILTLQPDGTYQ